MTIAAEPIVRVADLRVSFGSRAVLHGLTFAVERGEIFGFIGPNGAGKTTTIRTLATLLQTHQGEVWIDGVNVLEAPEEVRRRIGYMPDYVGVYPGLTVQEYLEFFAAAYRIRGARRRSTVADVVELTELGALRDREVQVLSKGMRQRLCLAQTLLHDPKLLILDEPASGLDPRARVEFRMLLRELREMGKTIFLSSHILTELSTICDSVGIIEQGRLITAGRVQSILEELRGESVGFVVTLVSGGSASGSERGHEPFVERLNSHRDVHGARLEGARVRFRYSGTEEDLHAVFAVFTAHRVSFCRVEREEEDLESVFMKLTRGEVS
ncbi:MAG: ABC transporter ATP-binding protein [Planctomycetota bacterium]